MTQEYRIWKPEHDGHAPPNWRDGMDWAIDRAPREQPREPRWHEGSSYAVPTEALNSPNDDAVPQVAHDDITNMVETLRQYPAEELAKHGITLAPEKDWATELWADLMDAWNYKSWAQGIRDGFIVDADQKAIECLRTRFEQMKGEG